MRHFIKNIVLGGVLFLAIFILVFVGIDYIGLSDHAYKRVVSRTEGSLIVGTSRAAQALQPAFMDEVLVKEGFLPFYNFAFTIIDSPFGELYYKAITRKMVKDNGFNPKRLFVVCVDPFSLSMIKELDKTGLREKQSVLYGIPFYIKPNLIYLIKHFRPREWIETNKQMLLHDDGWLEVFARMDSASVALNIAAKLETYRKYTPSPSKDRISELIKTIKFFQTYGSVFLCRLSTCMEMNEIEHSFWPDFDKEMEALANSFDIQYFSFVNDFNKYRTIDGNHIFKDDGQLISKAICDSVLLSNVHQ